MILDKKLDGILDQGVGHLIIYDRSQEDKMYKSALGITDNMSTVVDTLYSKALKINQS
jgi:26S proteasome regulatory subunit N6